METKKLPEAYQTISETMQLIQDMKSELDWMRSIIFLYYVNYGEDCKVGFNLKSTLENPLKDLSFISDLSKCRIKNEIDFNNQNMKISLENDYTDANYYFKICEKIKKLT